MKQTLNQAFKNIKEIEPSPKLEGLILAEIDSLNKKQAKSKLLLSYFNLIISLGVFALAIVNYSNDFFRSDFWSLLKLFITDTQVVLENWSCFVFSLLETFPVVALTVILIPILALSFSLSVYFKSIHKNHSNYI